MEGERQVKYFYQSRSRCISILQDADTKELGFEAGLRAIGQDIYGLFFTALVERERRETDRRREIRDSF